MSRVHSPTFPSLHLHHSSFSNPSVALPISQLILQSFHYFTYVTAHSPTLLLPLLHHRLFTYVTWWPAHDVKYGWDTRGPVSDLWAELILQPFRHFTCVTAHSPTLPSLSLHHSSFSNPSVASPTSQFILQPFFRFSYVTSSSLNSPGVLPMTKAVLVSTVRSYGWPFWQISSFELCKKAMK